MRVGVIGTGSMGANHVRLYSEMGYLSGITDLDQASGKRLAEKHGTEFVGSISDLLEKVDAVTVATPTFTHYDIVKQALEKGVDVLVEKPFTGDPAKAMELCRLAEDNGRVLAVGMVERFNPVVAAVKEKLDAGEFGRLITFSSRRVSSMPYRIRDVGVIMDLGIHDVDVFTYLSQSPVKYVYAIGGIANGAPFEDHAVIMLETEAGIKGVIEVNWLTPMKVRSVSLTCSKMFSQFDYTNQSISTSSSKYENGSNGTCFETPWEFDHRTLVLKKKEPLKMELTNFLDSVKGRGKPLVSGWEALNDLNICLAALRSIREGSRVSLS